MDSGQTVGCLAADGVSDGGAHVVTLDDGAKLSDMVHQFRPRAGDARARQYEEGVLGGEAMGGRVGGRADRARVAHDRTSSAVCHH